MTYLVDANLLVYAATPAMDEHRATRIWLTDLFDREDVLVGLSWTGLYAFMRIVANRRIMGGGAVGVREAWDAAQRYSKQPNAVIATSGHAHADIAEDLVRTPGLSANDIPDVHVAALAIENGMVLATHDHGFARFAGLRWEDPLATEPGGPARR